MRGEQQEKLRVKVLAVLVGQANLVRERNGSMLGKNRQRRGSGNRRVSGVARARMAVDLHAAAFEKSGFFGPVSFYRNMDANWERSKDIPPSVYTMPTGFVTGSLDPVNSMMPGAIEEMAEAMPDFRGATVIDGAGHWVQQERPAETNAALLSFLASV